MTTLRRVFDVVWPLLLATLMVVPALPRSVGGRVSTELGAALKKISVGQHWGMYVPNPQRGHRYMRLHAHFADGRVEPLEEVEVEARGWGTTWAPARTRLAIWRYYAELNAGKPNRNREWYLRGVCVREARRRGEVPVKIVMTVVKRRFAPPKAVREGKRALGIPRTKFVTTQYCNRKAIRAMIDEDPRGDEEVRG